MRGRSHHLHLPALLASALALACPGREVADGTGTGSSDASSDAATDPTTGTPTTGTPTTTATTTGASDSMTADTGGEATTGPATTEPLTTGEPTTSGASGTTTADTTTGTTGGPTDLILDPASLNFFELPIGSIRHAVAGFDPEQQTCVSVIFFGDIETEVCDDFEVGDNQGFPYVFITPNAAPPCMDWDYGGNVVLDAASGCVQLTSHDPLTIAIDMTLAVTGQPFTGTITVASP